MRWPLSRSAPSTAAIAALVVTALGCDRAGKGDPLAFRDASIVGEGLRFRQVNDPKSSERPAGFPKAPWEVTVTGAVVVTVDAFDETHDGKSTGTVYLEDVGSTAPFSGLSTFGLVFAPASLRTQPGDVLDLIGNYQETTNVGTAAFDPGTFLPQIFKPTATLRYEHEAPAPVDIDVEDLRTFDTGRRWIGMLVRVKDVTIGEDLRTDRAGRVTAKLLEGTDRSLPTVTNELYDMKADAFGAGTQFASITGVVTFFFNLHLAPRSADDLVP